MRYRVDELATRAGVSVDTVRFYQARGLLPPPVREGRVGWYSEEHADRLVRIRELKARGFTLATIRRLVAGELDAADEALVAAVAGPLPGEPSEPGELLTLAELAERTGLSLALLQAVEREGLLVPRYHAGEPRYTPSDVRAAGAGLSLLEAGLPLGEVLELAREHDRAVRATAERAVELFDRYVRGPIRESAASDAEAAERLVEAFRRMLPDATTLVAYHFQRVLLRAAQARIERVGAQPEIEAVRDEAQLNLEGAWPG